MPKLIFTICLAEIPAAILYCYVLLIIKRNRNGEYRSLFYAIVLFKGFFRFS